MSVKSVELGEFKINYATAGKGPTMILLHGSDKREDWKVWQPLLPLCSDYSLVIPDLIGFGMSTIPVETPDHRVQASVLHEMVERLGIGKAILVGTSWGGQVALEVAIDWPEMVESLILISSTYDKPQLARLERMDKPTMIIWAEDDLVAQLKAGYLLRDSIKTSRLELLGEVAKNPKYDFTAAHKLERYSPEAVMRLIRGFLSSPSQKITRPPELEPELKGLATKGSQERKD